MYLCRPGLGSWIALGGEALSLLPHQLVKRLAFLPGQ
jgi:hypothetical protein